MKDRIEEGKVSKGGINPDPPECPRPTPPKGQGGSLLSSGLFSEQQRQQHEVGMALGKLLAKQSFEIGELKARIFVLHNLIEELLSTLPKDDPGVVAFRQSLKEYDERSKSIIS